MGTELIDRGRYNACIAAQARIEQAGEIIEGLDFWEVVTDDEYDKYISPAQKLIEQAAKIVGDRAKQYLVEKEPVA